MNTYRDLPTVASLLRPSKVRFWVACLCALASLALCPVAFSQVKESAETGGIALSVGGSLGGYYVGYGQRKMAGPAAFIDLGSRAPLGFEAEARWLNLNETASVHDETYLAGPRYSFKEFAGLRPYAKLLIGDGEFSFPYHLAHGSYFVIAPGAGIEYRVSNRLYWRVVDFEYQHWSEFTYGSLPTYGVSSGLRVHIF